MSNFVKWFLILLVASVVGIIAYRLRYFFCFLWKKSTGTVSNKLTEVNAKYKEKLEKLSKEAEQKKEKEDKNKEEKKTN